MQIVGLSTGGVERQDIPGVFQLECFQVSMASVESFLLNLGSTYVIELINAYKASNGAHYNMLLERIAKLFLHLVHRIYVLEPQRNENNTARVGSCPAAMPFLLAEAGAFMFSSIIMEQRDCLAISFTEKEIDSIEVQFKVFLRKYHNDEVFKGLIENTSKCETFAAAWSWLYKEYPLLVTFAGGLATTFPGTSTVESDFSVLGWEKDEYRTMLSDLSLEGILQAKQATELKKINVLLNMLKT